MKTLVLPATLLVLLSGCGLENLFSNVAHEAYERPASKIRGVVAGAPTWTAPEPSQFSVIDGAGNDLGAFQRTVDGSSFEVRLPSSKYSMVRLQARAGNMLLRAVVPFVGEESAVDGVDMSPRNVTETLIVEARLSALGKSFSQLGPEAYEGARTNIRAAFDVAGPTRDLLQMVERIMAKGDPNDAGIDPSFFMEPVLDDEYTVAESPVDESFLVRNQFDYTGDGIVNGSDTTTDAFDAKLSEAAQLYRPEGCPDPTRIRTMLTVDFNANALNGNCGAIDRFKWAKDKPGKSMFFVGWVHRESGLQDPDVNNLVGASTPNQLSMYDDGTNGDEVAGDNIWTIYFDLPRQAGTTLRLGYKYTWGTRGAVWSGSEEWPGNSRIIQVEDMSGDGFVYRRDVFSDEATNKDNSNLYTGPGGTGSISWNTDLHGCGPEARENPFTTGNACLCGSYHTPTSVGPITVAEPPGGCP